MIKVNTTKRYKGYIGSIEIDHDNNILHGEVLFINSVITYEAENIKALQKAFEDSVDTYLELCQENNLEIEKPFSGTFNVRIGKKLHKESAIYSKKLDISINEFIKNAVAHEIERIEKQ